MGIHPSSSFEFDHGDADTGEEQGRHSQDQEEARDSLGVIQLSGLDLKATRLRAYPNNPSLHRKMLFAQNVPF